MLQLKVETGHTPYFGGLAQTLGSYFGGLAQTLGS